jgi:hypothetical protein
LLITTCGVPGGAAVAVAVGTGILVAVGGTSVLVAVDVAVGGTGVSVAVGVGVGGTGVSVAVDVGVGVGTGVLKSLA